MNVFDFDNTIYDGESGVHMFLFYLKRRPLLIRYLPKVIKGIISYKRGKVTQEEVLESYADAFHEMFSVEDFVQDMRDFWDKHEHRLRRAFFDRFYRPGDLIVSASPEDSLNEVCKRLGAGGFIGTRLDLQAARFEFVCFRENKVKAFREQFPGVEIENFYTDSMNDKAMMDISKHVFMIGKRGKMEQIK